MNGTTSSPVLLFSQGDGISLVRIVLRGAGQWAEYLKPVGPRGSYAPDRHNPPQRKTERDSAVHSYDLRDLTAVENAGWTETSLGHSRLPQRTVVVAAGW